MARIYLVHFRYNVVLDRVVYYSLFCLQFKLMGLLTNLKVYRIGLLARGCIHLLHSVCRWHCINLTYCSLTANNVDVCASFAQEVGMRFNSSKSAVMPVGTRFKLPCKPVMLCDKPLSFVNEVRYLGLCLLSGLKFKVSWHYMKCSFFVVLILLSKVLPG